MTISMPDGRGRARHFRAIRMALVALSLIFTEPFPTQAADGDLDKSFGMGGIVLTQFDTPVDANGAFSEGRTVAIQADGKIVAGGETDHNGRTMDAALARYNTDGTLDTTFGSGGKVITTNTAGLDVIGIQADGKIVAGSRLGLSRYTTDGSLDAAFGSGGMVATGSLLLTGAAQVHKLALGPDGKIIAAGTATVNGGASFVFAVLRFNADGALDVSFGAGGEAIADFPGHFAGISAVAIQPDGKIITAGGAQTGGPGTNGFTALARFNPDGTPDAAFGLAGLAVTQLRVGFRALAVLEGGKLLGIGGGGTVFGAARFNPDGSLDPTFGSDGVVTSPFLPGLNTSLQTAAIGPDGKFLAAGSAEFGLALARYNADGSPDTAFGAAGSVITHITDPRIREGDGVAAIAFQADGQIVVTGASGGDTNDLVLARYNTEPDFMLAFTDSTLNLSPGSRVKATLSVARRGGFTGSVTVTPPDTSSLDIKIVPDSVTTTDDSVKFKIKVRRDTPLGSHPLVFAGQSDAGQAHSITLTLVVQ